MSTGLKEQLRERAKLTSQQQEQERRQAVIDYVDGSTYSAEEWEARLQRLNWIVDDLERAGDRLAEHRTAQGLRAEGLAAAARLSEVQTELDTAKAKFEAEAKRIKDEFNLTQARLTVETGTLQAAISRGNDASVWLRERLSGPQRDAVDNLLAEQRRLNQYKQRLVAEQAGAMSFGTFTKSRREQIQADTQRIDTELTTLAEQIRDLELAAIAM